MLVEPIAASGVAERDATALAGLLSELGFPLRPDEVRGRLARFVSVPDRGVLVARADGDIAGVAAFHVVHLLERPHPQCRLTTLVVDARHRRLGLAEALLEAVEADAIERGCFRLEVTTRGDRPEALPFYLKHGFEETPRRLLKGLRGEAP